jgi:hypothetical protein
VNARRNQKKEDDHHAGGSEAGISKQESENQKSELVEEKGRISPRQSQSALDEASKKISS